MPFRPATPLPRFRPSRCGSRWPRTVRHAKETALFAFKTRSEISIFSGLPIQDKMRGDPEEDDENWFRPVWEIEDASLEPPGNPRARRPVAEPDYRHPLLVPLARAQDAVARLETSAETASPAIAEGLRADGLPGSSRLAVTGACLDSPA